MVAKKKQLAELFALPAVSTFANYELRLAMSAAVPATAAMESATAVESATAAKVASTTAATGKPATVTNVSTAASVESTSAVVSTTAVEPASAVVASTVKPATVESTTVVAVEPGARTDKDAAREPVRPVIAVRGARIGVITVIAVCTGRCGTNISVIWANSDTNGYLRVSEGSAEHANHQ